MTYAIAVPSFARSEIVREWTLATLDRHGVDRDRITVFVSTDEQRAVYDLALGGDWRVVVGRPGLDACRKWYANEYYPTGTRILNMDDDVHGLLAKDDNKLIMWGGTIDDLAAVGWGVSDRVGARLWGVAAAANAMFMHDEAVAGLRYICGIIFGSEAGDHQSMDPTSPAVSSGADFERSIRSFLTYGSVVRVDWITPKTKYFAPGGMMAELGGQDARAADHRKQLRQIALRYPGYAKLVTKAGGVPNLRLKSATSVRVRRGELEAELRTASR